MVVQDIKRGHYKNVEGDGLKTMMEQHFGGRVEQATDGWLTTSYGAITSIRAKVLAKDRLEVLSETDKGAPPEVAAETIRRWNAFLEAATGFNAKERSKRLQQKAKDGKL